MVELEGREGGSCGHDDAARAVERHLAAHPADVQVFLDLRKAGQERAVTKWLGAGAFQEGVLDRFFADLKMVDFAWLSRLSDDVRSYEGRQQRRICLEPFVSTDIEDLDAARSAAVGNEDIGRGRWGVVIFAGGAATRFWAGAEAHPQASAVLKRYGGNAPKGLFPVGPVTGRSFLDLFADELMDSRLKSGRFAPLVLMAGRATREALQDWVDHSLPAGFDREMVRVMVQAEHPRVDMDGDLLIRPDGSLVFTGDGHGGVFSALLAKGPDGSSTMSWLRERGVGSVVLHNVDNVAARALDPVRLGFHAAGGYGMTLSAVRRVDPFERVGIIALDSDRQRVDVVEYSVCPPEIATAKDERGELRFVPAHINTNLVELDVVRPDLPPTLYPGKEVDVGGRLVAACSHEMLNQSMAGLLDPSDVGVLVLPRAGYFQPTKSLSGVDSLETTREWLAARGWD